MLFSHTPRRVSKNIASEPLFVDTCHPEQPIQANLPGRYPEIPRMRAFLWTPLRRDAFRARAGKSCEKGFGPIICGDAAELLYLKDEIYPCDE